MVSPTSNPSPWDLINLYRERYDLSDLLEPGIRLERSVERRKARAASLRRRIEDLESQLAETRSKLKAVGDEIEGSRRAGRLFAESVLDEIRMRFGEGWSPTPILGYRIWTIHDGAVHGAQKQWRTPEMESVCLREVRGEDLPHSVTKCGPPACGVYVTKDLGVLKEELGFEHVEGYVMGVAALTGKVIEHDLGYRAARARAVAVAARFDGRSLHTDDAETIADLFQRAGLAVVEGGTEERFAPGEGERYLEQWKEQHETWIWATS